MPELLAPAGSFDALKAAVNAGADAVYLAGENFGARAYAENFSRENMIDAIKFAHLRGVTVHVTTNTILADDELENFAEYIKFLRNANVDALLVQDLGAAKIIRQVAPEIPLHASTQMTIHNLDGVKILHELGFSRVVLSRELSLNEIEYIAKNSPIETEIFIHGALCVCYSGQCLMSSLIGARSGNRGRCAQPCRLPYKLVDADGKNFLDGSVGEYLLSPKDLNTLELLPKLVETGVTSLKIEGRMKRPEYVATVVKVYRDALDDLALSYNLPATSYKLKSIFNRDFTTAHLERNQGKNLISDKRPNNRGVLVGRVVKVEKNILTLKLSEKISAGDQLEIWVKVGGRVTFTVEKFHVDGEICTIEVENLRGVKVHDRAFKIFDAELIAEAKKFFNGEYQKKFPVDAKVTAKLNQPLTLTMTDADGNSATASTNFVAEVAKNRPLTLEILQKQIGRLGNSVFSLRNLDADIDENLMMPISELNDVRRKVTDELESQRIQFTSYKLQPTSYNLPATSYNLPATSYKPPATSYKLPALIAQVDTPEKIQSALDNGADAILFGGENFRNRPVTLKEISAAFDVVHSRGKEFCLATPRIVRESEVAELEKILSGAKFDAVYVHNLATLRMAKKFSPAQIRTDFSLITFNLQTIEALKNLGVDGVTLSPEMTLEQVKFVAKKSCLPVECVVHGRLELMISLYCAIGSFIGNVGEKICTHPCRKNNFYLSDRKNILFPVVTDQFCRMHILNSKTLSMIEHRNNFEGVSRIRIDCRALTADETADIVRRYKFGGAEIENYTRGHYFRGVTNVD
ncbi:MAG: U32 family peptidase [Selenomonadaceae bacterium]|nr:U32 family peptidase [Selenomonadaceae bacterium]